MSVRNRASFAGHLLPDVPLPPVSPVDGSVLSPQVSQSVSPTHLYSVSLGSASWTRQGPGWVTLLLLRNDDVRRLSLCAPATSGAADSIEEAVQISSSAPIVIEHGNGNC